MVEKTLLTLITTGPDHAANWKHNRLAEQNKFDLKADDSSLTINWSKWVQARGHYETLANNNNNSKRNALTVSKFENDSKFCD